MFKSIHFNSKGRATTNALQFASDLVWCFEKPKRKNFICLGDNLSEAARKTGFTVFPK